MNDPYMYNQSYSSGSDNPVVGFVIFGILGFLFLALYIVNSLFLGKVFKKAGIAQWKAWVPFYNNWVFLELGDQPGWITLLLLGSFIPIIGFFTGIAVAVFLAIAAYKIGLKFGKDGVFVLLYIFLPLVWTIWLAVDKNAVYKPLDVQSENSTPPSNPTPPSEPAAM